MKLNNLAYYENRNNLKTPTFHTLKNLAFSLPPILHLLTTTKPKLDRELRLEPPHLTVSVNHYSRAPIIHLL